MTRKEGAGARSEERLRRQIAALSAFGSDALRETDLDRLLERVCRIVSDATDTELVKVLELSADGESMLIRAGVNWSPGVVGQVRLGSHGRSPGGYAMQREEPVLSRDTAAEERFEIPQVLRDHSVRSMVNVVIRGEGRPWGVLEADSRNVRDFDEDDLDFLQASANVMAAVLDRVGHEKTIRDALVRERILLGELRHRVRNRRASPPISPSGSRRWRGRRRC